MVLMHLSLLMLTSNVGVFLSPPCFTDELVWLLSSCLWGFSHHALCVWRLVSLTLVFTAISPSCSAHVAECTGGFCLFSTSYTVNRARVWPSVTSGLRHGAVSRTLRFAARAAVWVCPGAE